MAVQSYYYCVSFSPDRQTLALGSDETIQLWDASNFVEIRTLTGHTDTVRNLSFSADGQMLVSRTNETIRVWNVSNWENIQNIQTIHTHPIYSVSFSPNGQTLASGGYDETIRLWDVSSGETIQTFLGHKSFVYSVSFSPDGKTLASGSWDRTVRLWNVSNGHNLILNRHTDYVNIVSFSPNGQTLASGSNDKTIRLWDVSSGRQIQILTGHTDRVNSLSFNSDSSTLASASSDGTVLLWDLSPTEPTTATVSLSPATLLSPYVGEQLTLSLKITDGANIAGYQATLQFDSTALKYVESKNSDYLPKGAFPIPTIATENAVTLAAISLYDQSNGDGTLATITFEVVSIKASTVSLSDVLLTDSASFSFTPEVKYAEISEPPLLPEDVNQDGIVNILDLTLVAANFGKTGENSADVNGDGIVNIIDLTIVASAFGNLIAAPYSKIHNYLYIGEVRKPRQRECVGIVVH